MRFVRSRIAVCGPLLVSVLLIATLAAAQTGTWTPTGDLATARRDHTATLLGDGKVLIIGWYTTDAELFDPATGTFSPAGQTRLLHGQGSTATRLHDGRVLIVGGYLGNLDPSAAEIYDPVSGTFTVAGTPNVSRSYHTATLLDDGRVLIAAGQNAQPNPTAPPAFHFPTLRSAEIYDPASDTFTVTGLLSQDRSGHVAARLADGRVLIAGGGMELPDQPGYGVCLSSAEIYDPVSGTFSDVGSMGDARCAAAATLLATGEILVTGSAMRRSELFDPTALTFRPAADMVDEHFAGTATRLMDGRVLVTGGFRFSAPSGTVAATEIYDPAAGAFCATAPMHAAREEHTATLLLDGTVLVTGGTDTALDGTELASAERFTAPAECNLGSVEGRVRYSLTPLAEVTVELILGQATEPPLQTTTTDADGHYRFAGLAPGSYFVKRRAPSSEYIDWVATPVQITGGAATLDLDLPKIIALLTPPNGVAVPDAQPTLTWTANPEAEGSRADAYRIQINETSTWTLLEAGQSTTASYTVQAPLVPGTSYTWQVDAYDAFDHWVGTTLMPFRFTASSTLPPGPASLSGTVYYSSTPFAGVTVALGRGSSAGAPLQTTTTDGSGRYVFSGLEAGSYWVKVYGPPGFVSWVARTVEVGTAATTQDMDLPKPITLLAPADGATVAGMHPTLTWSANPEAFSYGIQINETNGWTLLEVGHSATASYVVQGTLVPGISYTWQVDAYDAAGHWVGTTPMQFRFLSPAAAAQGSVSGTVYYSTTRLAGLTVELCQGWPCAGVQTTTDDNGAYTFANVAPGSYLVRVFGPSGYLGWSGMPVEVVDGSVTQDLDLPKIITLLTPPNGATVPDAHPSLAWAANPDAVAYFVQINETTTWILLEIGQSPAPAYTVQGPLAAGTSYTWQVDARDAAGHWVGTTGWDGRFTWITPVNTPAGQHVRVTDSTGTAALTFDSVTQAGYTTLTSTETGPASPEGYQMGTPPTYYELTTSALYSGLIEVCLTYTGVSYQNESMLRLFHYENSAWVDVTTRVDTTTQTACGLVTSLSPFALFEPKADATPPIVRSVAATPNVLWPPAHQMVPVTVTAIAADETDPAPRCAIAHVASSEAINGLGDGDAAPDWLITGPLTLTLRSERAGKGTGRTYTIFVACVDASGNRSPEVTTVVSVPHSQAKR